MSREKIHHIMHCPSILSTNDWDGIYFSPLLKNGTMCGLYYTATINSQVSTYGRLDIKIYVTYHINGIQGVDRLKDIIVQYIFTNDTTQANHHYRTEIRFYDSCILFQIKFWRNKLNVKPICLDKSQISTPRVTLILPVDVSDIIQCNMFLEIEGGRYANLRQQSDTNNWRVTRLNETSRTIIVQSSY